jgi:hypothetical protein
MSKWKIFLVVLFLLPLFLATYWAYKSATREHWGTHQVRQFGQHKFLVNVKYLGANAAGFLTLDARLPRFAENPDRNSKVWKDSITIFVKKQSFQLPPARVRKFISENKGRFFLNSDTGLYGLTSSWQPLMVLHYAELPHGEIWYAECPEPTNLPFPTCKSKLSLIEGVSVEYRFNPMYLKDWRKVQSRLTEFLKNMIIRKTEVSPAGK